MITNDGFLECIVFVQCTAYNARWRNNALPTMLQSITVTSDDNNSVSIHQAIDCLFTSLSILTSKEPSKFCVTGSLSWESTGDRWCSLHNGSVLRKGCALSWRHYVRGTVCPGKRWVLKKNIYRQLIIPSKYSIHWQSSDIDVVCCISCSIDCCMVIVKSISMLVTTPAAFSHQHADVFKC